jgi:hypothetical protein
VGSVVEKSLRHQAASHAQKAKYDSRELTKAAGKANAERFERQVDPEGTLPPAERQRRAEHARKAYMLSLAYRSAKVRAERKGATP